MAGNNSNFGGDDFPFLAHDSPRPGQIDMIRECRESLRNKGHHLAAAPTGIGNGIICPPSDITVVLVDCNKDGITSA